MLGSNHLLPGENIFSCEHFILPFVGHLPSGASLDCTCLNCGSFISFSSVQSLNHVGLLAIPWTAACQASLSINNSRSLLKLMDIEWVMPSNHLILGHPLLPSIFPILRVFSSESVLHIRWPDYWSFQLQHQSSQWIFRTDFLEDGLVGSPCSPRDSQESSPTPQIKSINSSALNFLYSPTLTSIHDYWRNHSFDYMDLCQQSNISPF